MIGANIRLYTDEDVDPRLAVELQRLGYDVLSCHAAGNNNQRLSDEWQLTYATRQERAILVLNLPDYATLDGRWRRRGREHFGIIMVHSLISFSEILRRTRLHLDSVTVEQQYNTVLYLAR